MPNPTIPRTPACAILAACALGAMALLSACGGGGSNGAFLPVGGGAAANNPPATTGDGTTPPPITDPGTPPPATALLTCDDSMKKAFVPDANTRVLLAKPFKQGEPLLLSGTANVSTPLAPVDLCLVKMVVGPGNAGPADAPSTSAGIGIEAWLPVAATWNERIRAYGNGGWSGSSETSLTQISSSSDGVDLHAAAVGKGFVVATSDNGHVGGDGSFAMNPDGTINTVLWRDFAGRSLHEVAVKTKALVKAYYGKPQKYAYFDGYSTGGRQAMKLAQAYPEDFDGIAAGAPAFNWTRFITSELYPQIVMKRDLSANISNAKLNATTTAAISACGGATLGFLIDPLSTQVCKAVNISSLPSAD